MSNSVTMTAASLDLAILATVNYPNSPQERCQLIENILLSYETNLGLLFKEVFEKSNTLDRMSSSFSLSKAEEELLYEVPGVLTLPGRVLCPVCTCTQVWNRSMLTACRRDRIVDFSRMTKDCSGSSALPRINTNGFIASAVGIPSTKSSRSEALWSFPHWHRKCIIGTKQICFL